MDTFPKIGSRIEITFGGANRMISTTVLVREIRDKEIVLDIDGSDNSMTLTPGTDVYLHKCGGLYSVVEVKDYPFVRIEKVQERRHARVDDVLKVGYRKVTLDEDKEYPLSSSAILESVLGETQKIPEAKNVTPEMLYNLLFQINSKIDRLMEIMKCEEDDSFKTSLFEQVNISSAGIRLNLHEKFEIGDLAALALLLPLDPPEKIQVLGEVVASTPDETGDRYRVAFKFLDLSEYTEETIIRYVFKRQRELLRKPD